jgi:hypothetical protein
LSRFEEFDLGRIHPQAIQERSSKVHIAEFARPAQSGASFQAFFDSLPHILAGEGIRRVVSAIARARQNSKPVMVTMGAHVIKCGLSPVLIDLIRRGIITSVALNGAGAIHDSEVALFGQTSEDVVSGLRTGTFGMSAETAGFLNDGARDAASSADGLGETLGRLLHHHAAYADLSVLAACHSAGIPATVHVALGTDIVHMHPSADGAAYGDASMRDFRILAACLQSLNGGGVLMNIGSAVVLPEVVLKGFAILRSAGLPLDDFTSVNLDFVQQYRSGQQILARTGELGATGIALTGHHEILIRRRVAISP